MLTKQQLQTIHITRRKLEKATGGHFGRPEFDLVLLNLGNVRPDSGGAISSKNLTNAGFERVMAMLEEMLEKHVPTIGRYWRSIDDRMRDGLISRRQQWEVAELLSELQRRGQTYVGDGLARRMSNHRVEHVADLTKAEAIGLIEMLKVAIARQPEPAEAR